MGMIVQKLRTCMIAKSVVMAKRIIVVMKHQP
jgi:hypothetical protein